MSRKIIFILAFLTVAISLTAKAAAPITQEEIEAILERNQVDKVSSTSLPADLRRRLGQTVASTTEAIKPVLSETVDKAGAAVATATNKLGSTSDKIKDNLENYKNQAQADLKNTILGSITEALSSIWKAISSWIVGLFRGKS